MEAQGSTKRAHLVNQSDSGLDPFLRKFGKGFEFIRGIQANLIMAIIAVSQIQFNPTQPIGTNNLNLGSGFNAIAFHFHTSIICSMSYRFHRRFSIWERLKTRIAAFPQKRPTRSVRMTSSFAVVHGIRGESIGCPVVLEFSSNPLI